jgi:type IV secretory pathway TraG/TraD family ATPase VirD4
VRVLLAIILSPFVFAYKVLAVALPLVLKAIQRKKSSVHGDAAWATDRELRKGGYLEPKGFMPGVTASGRRVFLDLETSAVIFGSRGAGKTQTFIANLKAKRDIKPDLVIADPVGDIEQAVSKDLQIMGYGTLCLNLTDPAGSSNKYNPLSFLKPHLTFDYARDVMSLCELLMPEAGKENDAGMHFLESGRAMLQSMLMWRKGSSLGDIILRLLVEKKERTKEFATMTGHPLIRQGVEAFDAAGDRERGSMDSTLSRKLRPWLDDAVRHITTLDPNEDDWSFEDVFADKKPIAVFIRSGLGNEAFGGPFTRLVVGNAINTARRLWNQTGKPLPKGLWLYVDEARGMGNCSAVIDAVNELRKAAVNVFLCFHTLADVKETYASPQALLNGCAWVINGGSRDLALYREASQLAGDMTVTTKSVSKGDHDSETEHESGKPLIRVDELQKLAKDEVVVLGPGILAKLKKPYSVVKGVLRYR